MSRVITAKSYSFRGAQGDFSAKRKSDKQSVSRVLAMHNKKKTEKIEEEPKNFSKKGFFPIFVTLTIFVGAVYLYQVNDLATMGFKIRELEGKVKSLQKENKQMQIREVELRSMYNIEKTTQELNLVSPKEITYIEMDGPVAMR